MDGWMSGRRRQANETWNFCVNFAIIKWQNVFKWKSDGKQFEQFEKEKLSEKLPRFLAFKWNFSNKLAYAGEMCLRTKTTMRWWSPHPRIIVYLYGRTDIPPLSYAKTNNYLDREARRRRPENAASHLEGAPQKFNPPPSIQQFSCSRFREYLGMLIEDFISDIYRRRVTSLHSNIVHLWFKGMPWSFKCQQSKSYQYGHFSLCIQYKCNNKLLLIIFAWLCSWWRHQTGYLGIPRT